MAEAAKIGTMKRWMATAALAALTGCGMTPPTAEEMAADATNDHAEAISRRITRWQLDNHKPMEFARLALETEIHNGSVEVMQAEGDAWDDDGVLVVRITATGTVHEAGGHRHQATASACYRYAVTRYADAEPTLVGCPAGKPLAIPQRPPEPMLPNESYDRVRAALTALSPAQRKDLAAVRRAVEKGIAGNRGARVNTAVLGSALGVSTRAGDDCLLARTDGPHIAVWAPPAVYLLPGEGGCTPEMAASGHTPDPH